VIQVADTCLSALMQSPADDLCPANNCKGCGGVMRIAFVLERASRTLAVAPG
jgi:hypothetical protein